MKTKLLILSVLSVASIAIAADIVWTPTFSVPKFLMGHCNPCIIRGSCSINEVMEALTVNKDAPVEIRIIPMKGKYCVTAQYRKENPDYKQ